MTAKPFDLVAQSRALALRLDALPPEIVKAVYPALMASAGELSATMQALVPVDDGDLRDSIAVTAPGATTPTYAAGGGKRTATENQALVTVGNENARHGHLQEFGTVRHDAQPFMQPSIRLTAPKHRRRIARAIGVAIKAIGAKGGSTNV